MTAGEAKTFEIRDFRLKSGLVMPEVRIAYRTLGTLSPSRDNLVLVTHGYTGGPQTISPTDGGWRELVGPGKPVDTNRYFAICPNMLGSSYGSTNAASIDPRAGKPYGPRFPDITVSDIVATQRLLLNDLGVDKFVAVVGPSYGGYQAFQWAVDHPTAMRGIAPVVTSPSVSRERSEGRAANFRSIFAKNPNWNGGDYYDTGGVLDTLTDIRVATLKGYGVEARLKESMSDSAEIEAAIRNEATQWAKSFDANSLIILADALRGFDVTPRFSTIKAKVLFMLCRTDRLFPPTIAPGVMADLKSAGVDADYFTLDSEYGHLAPGLDAQKWASKLRAFMESLN
jgi:homoserine O-acetyltransferase/O-succinyltransferase